jgi:hypothetical protein
MQLGYKRSISCRPIVLLSATVAPSAAGFDSYAFALATLAAQAEALLLPLPW